jgi:hypothetical protein
MKKDLFETLHFDEFQKKSAYDFYERSQNSFSDELVIRKARIYKIMGPEDDRLQVQPLPEFMKLNDDEWDNLPIYPMFFKGEVITGEAIKSDPKANGTPTKEDKEKADCVWLMCTRDFTVGYVLSRCNIFGSGKKDEKFKDSYNWKEVKSFLHQRQSLPDDFDYKNLIVNSFDKNHINCYNRTTGDWVLMNAAGSILTVQQKKIYMCVGSPPDPVESGPNGFSFLSMEPDRTVLHSANIEFNYNDLWLGKNSMCLGAVLTRGPVIGRNGVSVNPIPNIHV